MAITLDMLMRGTSLKPPRILNYGTQGIGKTSLAAHAPEPILLSTEDGAGMLDVARFPLFTNFTDLVSAIDLIGTTPNIGFKTVILDTVDAAEPLVWAEACSRNRWDNIESPGFGKGYGAALEIWRELFSRLDALRNFCGMGIIYIAHSRVNRYEAPDTEAYDRHQIKLQDGKNFSAADLMQEHVDCVFFNNWRTSIVRDQAKGDKKGEGRSRGVGAGQRVLYTEERPAFRAKNRFSMPPSIDLPDNPADAWAALAKHIPYYNQQPALSAAAA